MSKMIKKPFILVVLILVVLLLNACLQRRNNTDNEALKAQQVHELMQKHLDAVSQKDLATLAATLSPDGQMQLILPGQEVINTAAGFLDFHRDWFAQPDWTFETQILNIEVGVTMAMAVVQIVYREPERDGQPYFNRMMVSYALQLIEGQWYVIKDHASSVEKSTDR